jgi:hypothetical protein
VNYYFTLVPLRIASNNPFLEANMNNAPQPTQPADPDMALLFFGSWFATLYDAPKRDHDKLNALAWHILGERPKTLLGLAVTPTRRSGFADVCGW